MAKFFGKIGYSITEETTPGVWTEHVVVREYSGDVIKDTVRRQSSGEVNDDLTISNIISILSDPFANQNFHSIRYVEYMGAKWTVTSVEVQFPRLLLNLGGVYNGS